MATASQDTEITLGTGKMLVIFFALVILCAVFFAMGFSVGKGSVQLASGTPTSSAPASMIRPTAVKSGSPSTPDLGFYKAVGEKDSDPKLAPKEKDSASTPSGEDGAAEHGNDPMVAPPLNGYYVQVAAVSKQEDAEALVDALKKKQYSAFTGSQPLDKLYHVEVGPFADIKDAESIRSKLVNDGYNPILKK
jgi:DedD protein